MKAIALALILAACGTDKQAKPDALPKCSEVPTCGVFVHNPDGTCAGTDGNNKPCTCAC